MAAPQEEPLTSHSSEPSAVAATMDKDAPALNPSDRQHRRDSLEKHLHQRPTAQELKDKHILLDTNAAPSLQAAQHDLEKQQVSDSLRKGLEKRPEREELEQRNILPEGSGSVAPSLQSAQKDLEKHMRKDSLEKHLQARPQPEELVKEGILDKGEVPGSAVE
ncbi:MAG: hypothetical protein Q9159_005143 [Coniocarpon cinnabarinum]